MYCTVHRTEMISLLDPVPNFFVNYMKRKLAQKSKWEAELEKAKIIDKKVMELVSSPDYRGPSEIEHLEQNLKEVEELMVDFQNHSGSKLDEVKNCPICFQKPMTVYDCGNCRNWICGTCKLSIRHCPFCRQHLLLQPMRRNEALELFLKNFD